MCFEEGCEQLVKADIKGCPVKWDGEREGEQMSEREHKEEEGIQKQRLLILE